MKYRSRMDIIGLILRSAMKGASKTKLMYGAYLSYAQLKEYLSFMEQKDLLAVEGQGTYRLTPRGLQFLNVYEELRELMSPELVTGEKPLAPQASSTGFSDFPSVQVMH